jgi:thiamine-monophosphate kinase
LSKDSHNPDALMSEEDIIRLVQSLAGGGSDELFVGIGDDAAVLNLAGSEFCVTTDLLVEGVHFDLAYTSPHELGLKAMAANLSDLAAMGALPRWGFLSLGLPARPSRSLVESLFGGVMEMCREYGLTLAGGDTVRAPQMLINLCLIGAAENRAPMLRSGARPGDAVCVTGVLGSAAAGLAWLGSGGDKHEPEAAWATAAHLRPQPRVAVGRALAQSGRVHAMMDLSDGLATDLARLCAASQVGAHVDEKLVPLAEGAPVLAQKLGADALDWALSGGEDFELLITCAPGDVEILGELAADSQPGLKLSRVGKITKSRGVSLRRADGSEQEITLQGFDHFREGHST